MVTMNTCVSMVGFGLGPGGAPTPGLPGGDRKTNAKPKRKYLRHRKAGLLS
jgi:hypothetical protein